ncbi:MAG TPA: M20/M25/M40 family metallo-hydrolase [Roseiflexaceae bacterium]|nr:M20/M25/M40 family metallo-hydrolase [Roseiflexaceae bacterium]
MTLSLRDELVAVTCDLIAIPSTADRPEALAAAIDYAERYARAVPGLHVRRLESQGKPSLVATLHDTRAPEVFLNAHLDVVPARPEQYEPVIHSGRIYGRGSQDMKGAAAVLLRLMKDLAALPDPPDVGFQFVTDEEIGGANGTGYLVEQGWSCRFFLAAEPTDLQICYAHKGIVRAEVVLAGRPAHGSRPWEGVNPIAALRDGLVALERRFPTPAAPAYVTTVVPTIVQAGEAVNRLPEQATLMLDIRHIPEHAPAEVISAVAACFPGATVRQVGGGGTPLATDPQHPEVQRLAGVIQSVTEAPAGFYREHFGTDARYYGDLGLPAVCCGPVGAGLHSDEEWVDIASLEQLYEVLRRFVVG